MSAVEYTSARARNPISITGIAYLTTDEAYATPALRERARKILADAELKCSELWIRHVYGYFKNMYVPESGSRNISDLVSDPKNVLPPERHAAVAMIREYFPDHQPRTDLIADPGKGYGGHPCTKCGESAQYSARHDALAKVTTSKSGAGITRWAYATECPKGGAHTVD